jgi:curved DNA-binding protein CbpA
VSPALDVHIPPGELDEECDLSIEQKRKILTLYYALSDSTYYSLLGIPEGSDRKAVKRAYYEIAGEVHPDKYFSKNIGSFKKRLELIFAHLSEALDTLTDESARASYDQYLEGLRKRQTKSGTALVAPQQAQQEEVLRSIQEALEHEAKAQSGYANVSSGPPPPTSSPPSVQIRPPTPEEIAIRKQALAKRLLGPRPPLQSGVQIKTQPAPPTPSVAPREAVESIRAKYEENLRKGKLREAQRQLDAAHHAIERATTT